ncbi:MAG TPA: hypothetical protein VEI96_08390 [Thermodesulfovibrionales bacterium]|nr:hypothetical protein [Thermodesulfovibrionales bacterium]
MKTTLLALMIPILIAACSTVPYAPYTDYYYMPYGDYYASYPYSTFYMPVSNYPDTYYYPYVYYPPYSYSFLPEVFAPTKGGSQ